MDVLGTSQAASRSMTAFAREAALAVAGAVHADPMVCRTDAGVTHCEAPPLNHYRVTGTRQGNRTYFEDNKSRRWMMIEEGAGPPSSPVEAPTARSFRQLITLDNLPPSAALQTGKSSFASASMSACKCPRPPGGQGARAACASLDTTKLDPECCAAVSAPSEMASKDGQPTPSRAPPGAISHWRRWHHWSSRRGEKFAIFGEVRRYGGCSLRPRRLCQGFCARCGRNFTGFGTQCSSCERAAEHDVALKGQAPGVQAETRGDEARVQVCS
jgi:hypothetical protein